MTTMACELCAQPGGDVVCCEQQWRVVLVDDAAYPGFCRVIWSDHAKEMTDLTPPQRALLMEVVWQVEAAVREVMRPDKINLASLGNMVPHLHWHIIPRYVDDAHFPSPIWAQVQRTPPLDIQAERTALLQQLRAAIAARFQTCRAETHGTCLQRCE